MDFDYVPLSQGGWVWLDSAAYRYPELEQKGIERLACVRVTGLKDTYPVFSDVEYACVMEYLGTYDGNTGELIDLDILKKGDIIYVPEFNLDVNGLLPGANDDNELYKVTENGTNKILLAKGIGVNEILPGGWEGQSVPYIIQLQESLAGTNTKLDASNVKLDSEIALTEGIRGAVVDVKNQPEDACIIRIYVGDQTKKREAAATEIERLLGEGYRPYQTFGISEDLARVLFVKYPEPNDANVAP